MIFDGRAFAREIEQAVKGRVEKVGKKVKIVSVMVGDDPASLLYTKLKKQAAERVGINFEVVKIDSDKLQADSLSSAIKEIGARDDVTGVMVQLPLPDSLRGETSKCLAAIPLSKDVDGLRWEESKIVPATVRAVLSILEEIAKRKSSEHSPTIAQGSELWEQKFIVVGARGAVGRPLVHFLRERGMEVSEVEWDTPKDEVMQKCINAEVLISCVGKPETVIGEMVRDGMIVIDVGMSEVDGKVVGDMTPEVYARCSVAVPVPGGVGPVTIACLLANASELYTNKQRNT